VALSSDTMDNLVSKLSDNNTTEALINGAYESHNLYSGSIKGKSSKTFSFRKWMDYDTTVSEGSNKTYTSKINVIARPDLNVNELNIKYELNDNTLTGNLSNNVNEVKYCVSEKNICDPNIDTEVGSNKIVVELENKNQIVCSRLNNEITICSNKLKFIDTIQDILAKYTKDDSRNGEITAPFTVSTPTTVYSKADDDGTSYFFAGENPNNWVKLGNLYFRIIRFNGNGTLRLIYSGEGSPKKTGLGTQISSDNGTTVEFQFNNFSNVSGYKNSTVKIEVEKWYQEKLKKYENLLDTNSGFCDDTSRDDSIGITYEYPFNAHIRIEMNHIPSLKCDNSLLDTIQGANRGNKLLTYPIGLITADEVALAGGYNLNENEKNNFWLNTGENYWTASACYASQNGCCASSYRNYGVSSNGDLEGETLKALIGVRPVINLKTITTFLSGNGTLENPYVVQI